MNTRLAWLTEGTQIYLGRVYGRVEKSNADGSLVLAFTFGRHGFTSRRILSVTEVEMAIERFDLRPRFGPHN